MGQYQQKYLNMKGCMLELAQRNSQVSVPFYVSSIGYGFLWNNPAVGPISLTPISSSSRHMAGTSGQYLGSNLYSPCWVQWKKSATITSRGRPSSLYLEWHAECTRQIDYLVIAGDTPAQIEETYMSLTGRAPMMPEYGLGFPSSPGSSRSGNRR